MHERSDINGLAKRPVASRKRCLVVGDGTDGEACTPGPFYCIVEFGANRGIDSLFPLTALGDAKPLPTPGPPGHQLCSASVSPIVSGLETMIREPFAGLGPVGLLCNAPPSPAQEKQCYTPGIMIREQ